MPATDIPWVTTSASAWDTLLLGPPGKLEKFPGLVSIKIKGGLEVERKKAKGKTGEKLTIHGLKACELDITLRVWTKAQSAELDRLFPLLEPSDDAKGKVPGPLEISHPTCTNRQVSSIIITDLEGPDITKGPFREYKAKAIEYIPEPPKTVGGTVKATAGALQANIDDLLRQKAQQVALQFGTSLGVPRSAESEVALEGYRKKIGEIDEAIRDRQAQLGGGKLPPTAPPPSKPTPGVATGSV
jgi:hypothetical protein